MANYPFRINIKSVDGTRYQGWYTASLATDSDSQISASAMVDKINAMPSASYEDGVATPSGTTADLFGGPRNLFLSCSVTDPNVGAIDFNDTESTVGGGLEYYTFWGSKVCSVLGLPEGIPIYTENFKLSDDSDDPDNYISGDMIADGLAIKESIKLSPQARIRSNLVWDEEFGEGLAQWVSGSSGRLLIGYDNVADKYKITADSSVTFDIEGVDTITTTNVETNGNLYLNGGSGDTKVRGGNLYLLGGNRASFDEDENEAQMYFDTNANITARGQFILRHDEASTWSNTLTNLDYTMILKNRHGNEANKFAGIAFDVGTTDNADAFSAAIIAQRDNATSGLYDTNLSFATNDASDDGLTKRMTITHDGNIGIGTDDPEQLLHLRSEAPFLAFTDSSNNSESGVLYRNTSGTNVGYSLYDFGNNAFKIRTNSSLALTIDSAQDATFTGHIALAATKGIYFDGGSHTYITEAAADRIEIVAGNYPMISIKEDTTSSRTLIYRDLYINGANQSVGSGDTLDADYLRMHNNGSHSYIDFGSGNLYIRDESTTAITITDSTRMVTVATDLTVNDDLFVGDCAHIDALHVGTGTDTDPGDGNLSVDGNILINGITDAGGVPKFLVRRTSDTAALTQNAWNTIVFNGEDFDAGSDFNVTNGIFTAPATGYYHFSWQLRFNSLPDSTDYIWSKLVTTDEDILAGIVRIDDIADSTIDYWQIGASVTVHLDSGDTVKVQAYPRNSGTGVTIDGASSNYQSWFSGHMII